VLREAPIHGAQDAAAFMLARCAGKDRYFAVLDGAWRSLPDLASTGDVRGWIMRLGQSVGMTEEQVDKCVGDQKGLAAMNARVEKEMKEFKVEYTPTFVVNGKKMETQAPPTIEELSAVIDPLLAAG
jgi:protein-disulfide isomerase